jgi:hypothetical protein
MSIFIRFIIVSVVLIANGCASSSFVKAKAGDYMSPDGSSSGVITEEPYQVAIDGLTDNRPLEAIAKPGVVFSADGRRWAYLAIRESKVVLVVDGKEYGTYDNYIPGSLAFDNIHSRLGFLGKRGEKWMVVIDGQESPAYDNVTLSSPRFSPDGSRYAYVAKRDDHWIIVVDGKEGAAYANLGSNSPVFSPDGSRIAYAAKRDDKWMIVVDGQESAAYDNVGSNSPVFSPDSSRIAYAAKSDGKWMIVVDGQESPAYDDVGSRSPVFSPDSSRVAYAAKREDKWLTVIDSQESLAHDNILGPVFLANNDFVYACKTDDVWSLRRNGSTIGREYEWIRTPGIIVSPDHKRIGYIGHVDDHEEAVIDDLYGKPYEKIGFVLEKGGATAGDYGLAFGKSLLVSLLTAPLGYTVAYSPSNKKTYLYEGGVQFSPDSEHYNYLAKDEDGNRIIIIDGVESQQLPEDKEIVSMRFSTHSDKVYVKVEDQEDNRIEIIEVPVKLKVAEY